MYGFNFRIVIHKYLFISDISSEIWDYMKYWYLGQ